MQNRSEEEHEGSSYVILSDIHNDSISAGASLHERGIVAKHFDAWNDNVHDTHLVITGDLINRDEPDHDTIRLFRHLAESAKHGNKVTLLLGNHELDLLASLAHERSNIKVSRKDLAFLGTGKMVYKRGPVLFLHAYPTKELLEEMVAEYEAHAGDPPNDSWRVNERFARAFELLPYAPSESAQAFKELCTLAETPRPRSHDSHSDETAALLERLHVKAIVHGHKRRTSGVQAIEEDIPGICMVNNDTAMAITKNPDRQHRIGSTVIRTKDGALNITCVNGESVARPNHVHTMSRYLH